VTVLQSHPVGHVAVVGQFAGAAVALDQQPPMPGRLALAARGLDPGPVVEPVSFRTCPVDRRCRARFRQPRGQPVGPICARGSGDAVVAGHRQHYAHMPLPKLLRTEQGVHVFVD